MDAFINAVLAAVDSFDIVSLLGSAVLATLMG